MDTNATDLSDRPRWQQPPRLAPRPAPTCRCAARDVVACRDDDGDWTCCSCGRLVGASATRLRGIRAAAFDAPLLAA